MNTTAHGNARAHFTLERTYAHSIQDVWDLWTTSDGIESWWGPEGFRVHVTSIDLRPGGRLTYQMIAVAPEQIAFMKSAGMPLSTPCTLTYTQVDPPRHLAYTTLTDFVPNVPPYEVATSITLEETSAGVRLTITSQAMHDDLWTERARAGYESQLRKLDALLTKRSNPTLP